MKLTRLTPPAPPSPRRPPSTTSCISAEHDSHVIEARRDLGDLDPILDGVLASVEDALTTTIQKGWPPHGA